jgi:transcriptional regulator with XRE-family HTH domain
VSQALDRLFYGRISSAALRDSCTVLQLDVRLSQRTRAEGGAVARQVHGLRQIREARALTQEQLAQRAGLNTTTISRIETYSHSPTITTLRSLAQALDMSVADLEMAINPEARALAYQAELLDQFVEAVEMAKDALASGEVEYTARALDILDEGLRDMAEDVRDMVRVSRGEKKETASDQLRELLAEMQAS